MIRKLNLMSESQVIAKMEEAIKYYYYISDDDLRAAPKESRYGSYIYLYLDPLKKGKWHIYDDVYVEYKPMYVGKGCSDRFKGHLYTSQNSSLNKAIEFIREEGAEPIIRVFNEGCSSEMAYNLENYVIARLREQGVDVCNATNQTNTARYLKQIETTSFNIEALENRMIVDALNVSRTFKDAAKLLGISERSLYRKIKSLNIVKNGRVFAFA